MTSVKHKIKYIIAFLFVFSAIQLLVSCNEDPTSMGSTLLQDTIAVFPISNSKDTLITGVGSFHYDLKTFSHGVLFIGKSNGYEAVSLIRLSEFIKLTDSLDYLNDYTSDKIISCKVKMSVNRYAFGNDSSNPAAMSFKVYPVSALWDTNTTWDNLDAIIDKSKLSGQFNGSIELKDTMPDIEFDLDKELVLDWIKKWYKYKNGDSLSVVYGLALVPDENSSVIRAFNGSSSLGNTSTKLTITFRDSLDSLVTINLSTDYDKPYVKAPTPDSTELFIQGGVSQRGKITFDVSKIPPLSAIHSAQLELTLDKSKCLIGNLGIDSIINFGFPYKADDLGYLKWEYYSKLSGDKFTFSNIARAIESWNIADGKGVLVFHPSDRKNEYHELDKLSFYGMNEPDSTKRPKLKIIYSLRPKNKK